jgi:hypothetical protein
MARVRCPGCHKRQGSTTIDANGGKCAHCGYNVDLHRFKQGSVRHSAMPIADGDVEFLYELAKEHNMGAYDLIEMALASKIFFWRSNPQQVKNDIMLAKLVKAPDGEK